MPPRDFYAAFSTSLWWFEINHDRVYLTYERITDLRGVITWSSMQPSLLFMNQLGLRDCNRNHFFLI